MAKIPYDFDRKQPYARKKKSKALRVTFLFIMVAAVTAAIIFAIVPRKKTEKGIVAPPAKDNTEQTVSSSDQTDISDENNAPAEEVRDNTSDSSTVNDLSENTPDTTTPDNTESQTVQNAEKDTPPEENNAKFDPSNSELLQLADSFRKSLEDGSWQKDAVIHKVAAGDTISHLALKYHTTVPFVIKFNQIKRANDIRIGQKIAFIRADKWQITISRKQKTLQVSKFVSGREIPVMAFPCKTSEGNLHNDLVICNRVLNPVFVDAHGRKFAANKTGNPYGKILLTVADAAKPASPVLHLSIHGSGDEEAVKKVVKNGTVSLNDQDIMMLYYLVPEKTPVKITE